MMGHRSFSDQNIAAGALEAAPVPTARKIVASCLRFDPDDRSLEGPSASVRLEPRVGQLFALLAGRRGEVIRREELQQDLWPEVTVGEDSLNRLVAALRRALRTVGAGEEVRIETISKAGYRLLAESEPEPDRARSPAKAHSRRAAVLLGGGALFLAAGGALWWRRRDGAEDPRVTRLLEQARVAQGSGLPEVDATGIGFLNEAIALDPDNAAAWGLLALAHYRTLENGQADESTGTADCELAARRALALDSAEPNARAALAILPPIYGDWLNAERRYDAVLRRDPSNLAVIVEKGLLMMSVGRCRYALGLAQRALALSPFAPILHYHLAFRLWAAGQAFEADRAIDRAAQLWPQHPGIRYARFLIFAGSGREAAALRMVSGSPDDAPLPPPLAKTWEAILRARLEPREARQAEVVALLVARASEHTAAAVNSILGLSILGAADEAFAVARAYLLRRGPGVGNLQTRGPLPTAEQRWRKTMMLFVPPTSILRRDLRFAGLAEDMGLASYWRATGQAPDFQRRDHKF